MSPSHNGLKEPPVTHEVQYKDKTYEKVREGLADILNLPSGHSKKDSNKQAVFYNPIQQFNRDLSVLAIHAFAEDLAVIRRARHERRIEKLAKDGKRGTKRKREQVARHDTAEKSNQNKKLGGQGTSEGPEESTTPHSAENIEQSQCQDGVPPTTPNTTLTSDPLAGEVGHTIGNSSDLNGDTEGQQSADGNAVDAQHENRSHHDMEQTGAPTVKTPQFRILDALSATGLRALRYVKEIPHVTSVIANDISSSATASIKLNAEYNGIIDKIQPTTGDAKSLMYHTIAHTKDLFSVIDLDPYGTAVPFLDAAVQALHDGGLLCVTCTDAGVFASVGFPEKTFSQYGGISWKGTQGHEAGLRLILNAVATSAAKYGLAIEPLLSLNIDFYARLFVRIRRSPADVKFLASRTMIVYNCDHGCGSFSTQYLAQTKEREDKSGGKFHTHSLAQAPSATPFCDHCGFKTHLAGPMWGGPLHNPHFIVRVLDMLPNLDKEVYATIPRIEGMLTLALNETLFQESPQLSPSGSNEAIPIVSLDPALRDPHPFFFNPSILARTLHCSVPSDAALRGALHGLGYRTTRSHTEPGSIRTDAPWSVIWEIMREWVRQKHPIKAGSLKKGMAGFEIMKKDRSNKHLEDQKEKLKKILIESESVESLKKGMEATLFRLSKIGTDADLDKVQDDELQEGTTGTQCHDLKVEFNERLGREAAVKKMVRYQMNPRADWGPMSKAKVDL
ncbi:MAG: hypothetical protein LQ337_008156 [Flavoplaca oasis]|nr:MAG: hypothetical protein LQ337_008156 [Flavoplaca oasis]